MLETLRSFAAARLDETGTGAELRRAHAVHFARLAAGSEEGMAGPDAAAGPPGWRPRWPTSASRWRGRTRPATPTWAWR